MKSTATRREIAHIKQLNDRREFEIGKRYDGWELTRCTLTSDPDKAVEHLIHWAWTNRDGITGLDTTTLADFEIIRFTDQEASGRSK
jgi:hypothetical protein